MALRKLARRVRQARHGEAEQRENCDFHDREAEATSVAVHRRLKSPREPSTCSDRTGSCCVKHRFRDPQSRPVQVTAVLNHPGSPPALRFHTCKPYLWHQSAPEFQVPYSHRPSQNQNLLLLCSSSTRIMRLRTSRLLLCSSARYQDKFDPKRWCCDAGSGEASVS